MSPGPSHGPARTGTAGLSQPTVTSSSPSHRGRGHYPRGSNSNPGLPVLRTPRLLFNGAKPHQSHPIPRGIPSNPPNRHPNQCKSQPQNTTLIVLEPGRTNTNPSQSRGNTQVAFYHLFFP